MVMRYYTDGACSGNPGAGGWAVVWSLQNDQVLWRSGCDKYATNNKMELLAVVEALKQILEHNKRNCVYKVYSDSAYVVNAINKGWLYQWRMRGWKTASGDPVKNIGLWKRVYRLLRQLQVNDRQVLFVKVKGHSGNPLNEYADKIAKAAKAEAAK